MPVQFPSISIRPAGINDRKALWQWKLDCMHYLLLPTEPNTWEEHVMWMDYHLERDGSLLLIGVADTFRVGAVWLQEVRPKNWRANLLVKPLYMARGTGNQLLKEAEKFLIEKDAGCLIETNKSSPNNVL